MSALSSIAGASAALILSRCVVVALVGRAMGVAITHVRIGLGPLLANFSWIKLRAFPLSSHVRFRHSAGEQIPRVFSHAALDSKPFLAQLLLTFHRTAGATCNCSGDAGRGGVFSLFVGLLPGYSRRAFSARRSAEIDSGGISLVRASRPFETLGLVAAKMAAIKLLPLPAMNGGAAFALALSRFGLDRHVRQVELKWLTIIQLCVVALWAFAAIVFVLVGSI